MKKNVVKLNETQLRKVVAESVKRILSENNEFRMLEDKPYDELIKDEMHRLAELSEIVPKCYEKESIKCPII